MIRTIAAVLARAGLSTRAFYRHFESKDELFLAMLEQESSSLVKRLDDIAADVSAVPAAQRAAAYGIEGMEVDGNDPAAVFDIVSAARSTSLDTQRPVLVEAHTHRLAGHYSGDAQVYRPAGELEHKRLADPLVRARQELSEVDAVRIDAEVGQLVDAAFETAVEMPFPSGEGASRHVYSG